MKSKQRSSSRNQKILNKLNCLFQIFYKKKDKVSKKKSIKLLQTKKKDFINVKIMRKSKKQFGQKN